MNLEHQVHSLVADWEGLPVSRNSTGGYDVDFGDDLACTFSQLPDGRLLIESDLGGLPGDEWEAKSLLEKVLQLNLAQQRERRPCVSLDDQTGRLVMFCIENADNSKDTQFEEVIEDYLNHLEFWRRIVQTGSARTPYSAGLSP